MIVIFWVWTSSSVEPAGIVRRFRARLWRIAFSLSARTSTYGCHLSFAPFAPFAPVPAVAVRLGDANAGIWERGRPASSFEAFAFTDASWADKMPAHPGKSA